MKETAFSIEHIPSILYGAESDQVYLFIHGKCGKKEEAKEFAESACHRNWQVLAIDLPEHDARCGAQGQFDPWHVVPELKTVMSYIQRRWKRIALRANSIGAWFGMLAFSETTLENSLFVSPVLDMKQLIQKMMGWVGVTEEALQQKKRLRQRLGKLCLGSITNMQRHIPLCGGPVPQVSCMPDRII